MPYAHRMCCEWYPWWLSYSHVCAIYLDMDASLCAWTNGGTFTLHSHTSRHEYNEHCYKEKFHTCVRTRCNIARQMIRHGRKMLAGWILVRPNSLSSRRLDWVRTNVLQSWTVGVECRIMNGHVSCGCEHRSLSKHQSASKVNCILFKISWLLLIGACIHVLLCMHI